jgi:hypothetical protein
MQDIIRTGGKGTKCDTSIGLVGNVVSSVLEWKLVRRESWQDQGMVESEGTNEDGEGGSIYEEEDISKVELAERYGFRVVWEKYETFDDVVDGR